MEKKIRFEGDVGVSSLHGPGDQRYCLIELDEILQGRLYYENGNLLYEGDFHYGQPSGQGKIFWESGNLWYEGELEDGTLQGYGTLYREDGSLEYKGEFGLGMKQGEGTEYYPKVR